jgi:hypothetical protein
MSLPIDAARRAPHAPHIARLATRWAKPAGTASYDAEVDVVMIDRDLGGALR